MSLNDHKDTANFIYKSLPAAYSQTLYLYSHVGLSVHKKNSGTVVVQGTHKSLLSYWF